MADESQSTSIPIEADISATPIVTFKLDYADFRNVLTSLWDRINGTAFSLTAGTSVAGFICFGLSLAYLIHAGHWSSNDDRQIVVGLSLLTGFFSALMLTSAAGYFQRRRRAAVVWNMGYQRVPSPLTVRYAEGGLLFTGSGYTNRFAWLDIKRMWLTRGQKIWAAHTVFDSIIWIPASAFERRADFDNFADAVHEQWKAAKPTGRAFEVMAAVPVMPAKSE